MKLILNWRYFLFLLVLIPTPCVLAAPTVHLDPPTPILGKPLSILITLDDEETRLAGLPDLGVFEPLAPPLHHGQEIRLVVLPMRAGLREIPPFPLQVGTSRQIETEALRVTVLEGIALNAVIAPLKGKPFPLVGAGPRGWIIAGGIFTTLIGVGLTLFWRWWQRPDFFQLPLNLQLTYLDSHARRLPPSAEQDELLIEIERRRFAPFESSSADITRLYRQVLSLRSQERG